MKYSKQREIINQFVRENNVHPSADEVYVELKKDNPNLSLGTVYRNLAKLSEDGKINRMRMPNGSDRFDGQLHEHYHAICKICGKIIDLDISLDKELDERISKLTGMVDLSHQFSIHGICLSCQSTILNDEEET